MFMVLYMLSEMTKDYFLSASRAIYARLSNSDEENNVDCVTFFHPLVFHRVNIASTGMLLLVLSPELLEIVFGRGRKMMYQCKRPFKILMWRVNLHIIPCFEERKKPRLATNFSSFTLQLKTCQYENLPSPPPCWKLLYQKASSHFLPAK